MFTEESNASSAITAFGLGIVTVVNFVLEKALPPVEVTVLGIVTLVRPLQQKE